MINIAVIVPVHNRKDITIEGLGNLSKSLDFYKKNGEGQLAAQIIVVDDGSSDGTGEWITDNKPDITLLRGDGSLWWSGSINLGARYACANEAITHVLFWNDDTICELDYFVELEKVCSSDTKYKDSILVSKVFWLDKKQILFNFGCYYNSKSGKKTLVGLNEKDSFNEIMSVDWSGGMGTLIPLTVIKSIGFVDEMNFPQYHGDIDFFLRAKENGFLSYAIPNLKIYNNAETTGLVRANKLSDLKRLFTSNSSLHNFKQNYYFNKRHSNTSISWIRFYFGYAKVILKSLL